MSVLHHLKRMVPAAAKRWVQGHSGTSRLLQQISACLPEVVCVDVGASYYPHGKWRVFLESPRTRWIAVEPNVTNLGYIRTWAWPSKVSAVTTGLSQYGGRKTLYITHVDSGSSLLPPVIAPGMAQRIRNRDYFFPVREQQIDTLTLAEVLADSGTNTPVFVKLDTQGTELSILAGAEPLLRDGRIVGIEMESTMQAQPVMQGAGKFWEACQYLEGLGFELLHVKPIYGASRFGRAQVRGHTFLNECDAVFAVRPDIARGLSVEVRVALLGFYAANGFYEESLSLLEDAQVRAYLEEHGCDIVRLSRTLHSMA